MSNETNILGMGTIVSYDIPPLKMRDESHYHNLDKEQCYGSMGGYHYQKLQELFK